MKGAAPVVQPNITHLQHKQYDPEDGGKKVLRNVIVPYHFAESQRKGQRLET